MGGTHRKRETSMTDEQMALIAKALAHPTRIRLMKLLAEQTQCRGQETFSDLGVAQSTLSEHLRALKDAGLVSSSPQGTALVYCLCNSTLDEFLESVGAIHTKKVSCS